jgi:flagellin
MDNALLFTGMDNGPVVRLSVGKPNQELGIQVILPSTEDIANGIHTPILRINLATDAGGNSITTAKQLVEMFNRLTPAETLGVSASLLLPPGIDPNTSDYGKYGNGIVQPTGSSGSVGSRQGDLVLLGNNQNLVDTNAVARIGNANAVAITPANAVSVAGTGGGTAIWTFENTSAMNGMKFGFTFDETKEGFDAITGQLTVFLNPTLTTTTATDADLKTVIDSAIAANWEAIRAYTGAVGDAVQIAVADPGDPVGPPIVPPTLAPTIAQAQADAASGATTEIVKTTEGGVSEERGVGVNDPVLLITANTKGTKMAGYNIQFLQDTALAEYNTLGTSPDISVTEQANADGTKTLVIKANATQIDAIDLAKALNSDATFKKLFTATAALQNEDPAGGATAPSALGDVAFTTDKTHIAAQTTGGYRIESAPSRLGGQTGTSSGISMFGQSDSNERLILEAVQSGSSNFVDVRVTQGLFTTYSPLGQEMTHFAGENARVTVNGQTATADGDNFKVSSSGLQLSGTINNMDEGDIARFSITGGGAIFQLGPDVVSNQQIRIGISSVDSTNLGGSSGKLYQLKSGEVADLKTSTMLADRIVQEAINSIAVTRGTLGATQRSTLSPNQAVLEDTVEQLSAAEAIISNVDFAEASSAMTRAQVLVQSSSQMLSIANQFPQYAAQLLR